MSWHERSCGIPDLSWAGGYPTCIRCGSSASSIANGSAVTPPPPAPPPCPKRSQLVCSWPPCVEYSDSYIDENGNDVTVFITENIDAWNIDQAELPDDQANFEENGEASQQAGGNNEIAGLSGACSNTTNTDTDASDGLPQTTHSEMHTVAPGPMPMHLSDRIHEPLSGSDDFRLLRLYGSASSDASIHCSLEVAQLDDPDAPLYDALSYTWADLNGDKRNCMPVYFGSHFDVLLVTKSCYSALRKLRKRIDRLLWIDAICINQNDSSERSAQVNHMATIYSRAARVCIYLGEETEDSEQALSTAAAYSQNSTPEKDKASLVELSKRPYFKRLWIIQEVALAVRASVTCGESTIHWTDLCSALQSCGVAPAWMKHFLAPVYARREAPSVLELLQDTEGALCIDPRDRLFGIIGLANQAERECFPTDYSLSVQQLYTGLAAYWIQKTKIRSFLKLACDQRKMVPGLPSWVPDWTNIKIQDGARMPTLYIGSHYAAFPQLFWSPESGRRFGWSWIVPQESTVFKQRHISSGEIYPLELVQTIAGALHVCAYPLFRISCGELETHEVAGSMRITHWHMDHDFQPSNHTNELEIFAIPSWNGIFILKKHGPEIFSLRGVVSIYLAHLRTAFEKLEITLHLREKINLQRWFCMAVGLYV